MIKAMKKPKTKPLSHFKRMPKLQIHEHIDCSLRPRTCVELWAERNFEIAEAGKAAGVAFPAEIVRLWKAEDAAVLYPDSSNKRAAHVRQSRQAAVKAYDNWVASFAQESLDNYLAAIVFHVLPLMHDLDNLTRIVRERIEDAVKDGHIAIELRFAPQLHLGETGKENSLDQVMKATIAGLKGSPIPVKLIVCALRHENGETALKLADIAIKYRRNVGAFDLAASETVFPGVLDWWVPAALRIQEAGLKLTIHLWETQEPTDLDIELLTRLRIGRVGHGVRGDKQGNRVIEVCPTSNVVTGQYNSIADHPVDRLYRQGKRVCINTDGTLFTQVTLSGEYHKLALTFGWTERDFLVVNLTALEASSFCPTVKGAIKAKLLRFYKPYLKG